jgi:hypothetical protein
LTGSVNYTKKPRKGKKFKRSKNKASGENSRNCPVKPEISHTGLANQTSKKGVKGTPYEKPLFALFLPEFNRKITLRNSIKRYYLRRYRRNA